MTYFKKTFAILTLFGISLVWLIQDWVSDVLHLKVRDNCLTWALRNHKYTSADWISFGKSESGWFPHVKCLTIDGDTLTTTEFVPVNRVHKSCPPHRFDGYVKTTRYVKVGM